MSTFRHWVHEQLARLDGAQERRFVALAAVFMFVVLAFGPTALKAVTSQSIQLDQPIVETDRVRFPATLSAPLENLHFKATSPDGSTVIVGAEQPDPNAPLRRVSLPFLAVPDVPYEIVAVGVFLTSAGPQTIVSAPLTFTLPGPGGGANGGGSASDPPEDASDPRLVELLQAVPFEDAVPYVEARGRATGFTPGATFFRFENVLNTASRFEFPSDGVDAGMYRLTAVVPADALYRVTFVARDGTEFLASLPLEVRVPKAIPSAEADPEPEPAAGSTAPPPPPPPAITLLLPHDGEALVSPTTLLARVTTATATRVAFDVFDQAANLRSFDAARDAADWFVKFSGAAGQYAVRVRAFLEGGSIISTPTARSFTFTEAPVQEPSAATSTSEAAPASAPFIELFWPPIDLTPLKPPVAVSVRVRNGIPASVAVDALGPDGRAVGGPASRTPTGDYWEKLIDGPDGEYRYRVRAVVDGKEISLPERRFLIKRPVVEPAPLPAGDAPPPTLNQAPPPPPPPGTATSTATAPPPPLPAPAPRPTDAASATAALQPAAAPVPAALAEECKAAGIRPERCADWLRAKHQNRACLEAGAVTREACAAVLQRLNVPADETALFGLASREDIAQAREDARKLSGAAVRREDLPPSIVALLPPARNPEALVRVFPVAGEREGSSPGLLVLDTDGDGLPDDVERRRGTDPEAADTDGDGFKDGDEVRNGYNPLGPGTLAAPIRGVEKALLDGLPLEEPRGAEVAVDPAFTIAAEAPAEEDDAEDVIRLSGAAAPNSVVTIFVYSYLPVVVTTTTDENGNWTYDFGSKLAEGRHEAYVSINDDTGKLVASSSPLAFFVREAQAVSEEDFLRPDINVEEAPATLSRWFIWGGIALVAVALLLVVAIVRQTRKEPTIGSGEGL